MTLEGRANLAPRHAMIASAVGLSLAVASVAGAADPEALKASTVRITVEHGEGSSTGAGIILCHRDGRLDVLTAKHVLTGRGLVDESGVHGKRFPGVEIYEVAFYRNSPLPVRAPAGEAIVQRAEYKDLALLTLAGVQGRLQAARLGYSGALHTGAAVESVGHLDVDWDWTRGEVKSVGEFIRHSSDIDQGYSGGPLFDASGEVVGLNLQTKRGVARAMPIEEAMLTVRRWIDPQCLGREPDDAPPPSPSSRPAAGQREVERVGGVDFAWRDVPADSFQMGSPAGEEGRDEDETLHWVTLTRGFRMGETEVTRAQWRALMGTKPAGFKACGAECPVETVNWFEAVAFANELSRRSDLEACYRLSGDNGKRAGKGLEYEDVSFKGLDCPGYRLPTEAEWEYAARAKTTTPIYSGEMTIRGVYHSPELDEIAWYGGNSGVTYSGGYGCSDWEEKQHPSDRCGTHAVGRKTKNAWGLADMLGNVSEWTQDAAESRGGLFEFDGGVLIKRAVSTDTYRNDVRNPLSTLGSDRVVRGGSWNDHARDCRSANRGRREPGERADTIGFRLVRTLP